MKKNLIKISLFITVVYFSFSYVFIIERIASLTGLIWFSVLSFFSFVSIIYLVDRISNFFIKLSRLLDALRKGNYEVGLKQSSYLNDEIESLNKKVNEFLEQLRVYENLRIERITSNAAIINLIYENIEQGLVIADLEKEQFRFNPAARRLFNVKQEIFSFQSLKALEENHQITRMFLKATEIEKIPQAGKVTIQLPVQVDTAKRNLFIEIIPIKDKDEKVKLALIFVKS